MKILVINPGSTSTKIAVYENETPLFISNIKHSVEELSAFPEVIDQFEFRKIWYYKNWRITRSLFPLTQSLDAEVW